MSRRTHEEADKSADANILQKILEKIEDLEKSKVEEARTPSTLTEWFEQIAERISDKALAKELLNEYKLIDEFGLKKAMALRDLNNEVVDKTMSEWRLEARIAKIFAKQNSPKKPTTPNKNKQKSGYFYRAQYIGRYKLRNPKLTSAQHRFMSWKIQDLLELGKIRKWRGNTSSLNIFPIQLVRKEDSWRFTVNFSQLRGKIKIPEHSFGRISDIIKSIPRSAKCFASVDLKNAYWNVPVLEKDQNKLGFYYKGTPYTWCYMPQGIPNAPYHFHKYMEWILKGINIPYKRYFDDFLIYGKDRKEVSARYDKLCKALKQRNFDIGSKSQKPTQTITWCGYSISGRSIEPPREKVAEWRKLAAKPDQSIKHLRRIQGKLAYYHWMSNQAKAEISILHKKIADLEKGQKVTGSREPTSTIATKLQLQNPSSRSYTPHEIIRLMGQIIPKIEFIRWKQEQPIGDTKTKPFETIARQNLKPESINRPSIKVS